MKTKNKIKKIIKENDIDINDKEDLDFLFNRLEQENIISYGICLRGDSKGIDFWLQIEAYSNKLCKTIIYSYNARESFEDEDDLIDYALEVEKEIEDFESRINYV